MRCRTKRPTHETTEKERMLLNLQSLLKKRLHRANIDADQFQKRQLKGRLENVQRLIDDLRKREADE